MGDKIVLRERSTRELMDWLKENGFPSCHNTLVYTKDDECFGMISDFVPEGTLLESLENEQSCEHNGMKRWKLIGGSWMFFVPEINKYYYFSI